MTGYAVKPSDFEEVTDGGYRAVLTDASAHAWPEIFIEDLGWTPVEVTPAGEGYDAFEPQMDEETLLDIQEQQQWNLSDLVEDAQPQEEQSQEESGGNVSVEPAADYHEASPEWIALFLLLFAVKLADIFPEESPDNIKKLLLLSEQTAFGRYEAGEKETVFAREMYRRTSEYLYEHLNGIRKIWFNYIKFFC